MKAWVSGHRVLVGVIAIVLLVLGGGGYVAYIAVRQPAASEAAPAPKIGDVVYIDLDGGQDRVTTLRPDGQRIASGLRCQRFHRAGGTSVCLRLAGPGPTYEAAVLNADNSVVKTVPLPGIPSRARVSASGNIVAWTSFVTGDSYTVPGGFSTRAGFLDLRTGAVTDSIEHFDATVNNRPLKAADVNYWGITVAADDNTFYATLASGGLNWLVKGDLTAKTARSVRQNAECPSLSPDGTRVAYKKRPTPLDKWSLVVLDLRTNKEITLPETSGIDDQAVWLDESTLAFGAVKGEPRTAVYFVPADGSAPAKAEIHNAASPVSVK
ncbi:hypothetical protein ALI144C_45290 [Actinosynnema sp. ALI-1.44]|uniref:PD40 domain-containing protein n=1 Tax=Actinosynnema sp. ALI-1.44 TaxID=1933779 RepID=UPI00097BAC2E|nr:PD40 domain-containing protein [Actinosynnema sp. ALI-1.44]ONI73156.1 hypothetical protein ALI144C_45290 [Actinosynnema sp. ALI-1.44]